MTAGDAEPLFEAGQDPDIWTYLPYGPFESVEAMRARLDQIADSRDPIFFTVERERRPEGPCPICG